MKFLYILSSLAFTALLTGAIVSFEDQDALTDYGVVPRAGTAPFRIGTEDLSSFFHGSVGKVALYNYELSAAQSLQHARWMFGG